MVKLILNKYNKILRPQFYFYDHSKSYGIIKVKSNEYN